MVLHILPQWQKFSWDYFAIRNVSTFVLCTHIKLSSCSNVNVVERLVIPAMGLFVGSALTISFGFARRD